MPSYYLPELTEHSKHVMMEGDEFHHLSHVKRVAVGDHLKLNNGTGIIAEAMIAELNKRNAKLEITATHLLTQPDKPFAIAFALLKNKHDELIIEKCTELGAQQFFPFTSEHSVRTASVNTSQRFERIALAAIKQCDNPFLPLVNPTSTLTALLKQISDDGWQPIVCSESRPDVWLRDLSLNAPPCFVIGPEGGWDKGELSFFADSNISEISISRLILRAETAAIAVASQYAGS
jgi:16S rRNA (uracil1498-N3)-methyltransferase